MDPRREGNLARESLDFIGRGHDLENIAKLLDEGGRVVTLSGPGGIGKTRLAREVGLTCASPDGGVWFCDLSESRSVDDICNAVARALNVPITGGTREDGTSWPRRVPGCSSR